MIKSEKLSALFAKTVKVGGGVHSAQELAFMLGEPYTPAFVKFLSSCAKKGTIRRLAKGIFESTLTPPNANTAIYQVIKKLRGHVLSYISLESQLSFTGDISQIIMDRVTVMTKGRGGEFVTPYGTIEFVHSKKAVSDIMPNLYFDANIGMYRASAEQAIRDLKDCNRNLHMLEN